VTALRRIAAALTYRDFRVLWFGAFTSTIGTWMQKVAQNWLVLTITGSSSAFFLGLDSFLGELPILLFTLIGGVVADRHDRRQLLLASQYVQMTAAFTLAALVYFDVVRIWHVLALSVMTGLAQAFGGPAYQSLLPSLVEKEHVPNAIAFNSIQFQLSRVIGSLAASATFAAFGMVVCFGLNGLSFLAVIIAILSLRIRHIPSPSTTRMHQELRGGFSFVRANPGLIGLAVLGFATTFLGNPLLTFLPVFTKNVLGGDIDVYTYLMAFAGAGAAAGALVVAWRRRVHGDGDGDAFLAGAAERAKRDARARDEHLHGGVPRRDAARQPGGRMAGNLGEHADRAHGKRRAADRGRRLVSNA
jgi:MFS family permease